MQFSVTSVFLRAQMTLLKSLAVAAGKEKTKKRCNQRRSRTFWQAEKNFKRVLFMLEKTLSTNANFKRRFMKKSFIKNLK